MFRSPLGRWCSSGLALGAVLFLSVASGAEAARPQSRTPATPHRYPGPHPTPAGAIAELRRLLAALPQTDAVCSARIVDLSTGAVLAECDPDHKLIPASNQKLWALAAASAGLGEDFSFRTVLAARGGEVFVIGDGDPGFGDPRLVEPRGDTVTGALERWAAILASKGYHNLAGRLIYDDSIFDRQWTHPTWSARDAEQWYAAPVSAFIINDNCIDVTLRPADRPGAPVGWSMVPPNRAVEVVNRCASGGKNAPSIDRADSGMQFVISGRCSRNWEFPSVAIADPVAFFAGAFRQALRAHDIAINEDVRLGRARLPNGQWPDDLTILAEQRTPLAQVLSRAGKDSQNLFAEALLKRVGFEWERRAGRPNPEGSWKAGRAAMLDFAQRAGIDLAAADYQDASGLSRENRLSAAQAVALLSVMHRHRARDLFVNSLSVAGQDGTLKKRMGDIAGRVHAKTGYVNGVRTLSGYVVTPKGHWFAFSVLFNGIKGGTAPYNELHDSICRVLANWPEE